MKDIKIKYSLIALSYLFLIFLIIISYVSIMPEEDIPILENSGKLIKEEKNFPSSFMNYVSFLEKELKVPIAIISVGPDRTQTIIRK